MALLTTSNTKLQSAPSAQLRIMNRQGDRRSLGTQGTVEPRNSGKEGREVTYFKEKQTSTLSSIDGRVVAEV